MSLIETCLVVGGGIAGMSCATALSGIGVKVEIVELDPEWRVYGAGISMTAPTLRAFDQLGLRDDITREGFCSAGLRVFTPTGHMIFEQPSHGGAPQGAGIMRPALHRILQARIKALGVPVRLGLGVEQVLTDGDVAKVVFSDGSTGDYDLVVGADGLFSRTRAQLFPDAPKPEFTGQGCWRVVSPRPPEVEGVEIYLGADTKAGLNPVSEREMYLFVLEHVPDNPFIPPEAQLERVRTLLAAYGGHLTSVREGLSEASSIVYRPLECILAPPPWHSGRVVLIGDAVHGTTPHLAAGAGMAVEDAIVLSEELARATSVEVALQGFLTRRFDRCRMVVENSLKLGEIEMARGDPGEHQRISRATADALAAAI
jgi:2-polyprenyl-6-methoxyphenol hydroxylase-like FAD-dependent oxidoreductase